MDFFQSQDYLDLILELELLFDINGMLQMDGLRATWFTCGTVTLLSALQVKVAWAWLKMVQKSGSGLIGHDDYFRSRCS